MNWFFFGAAKVAPAHEEAVHYKQAAPGNERYSVERFRGRTTGLFFALEQRLKETGDYLVGNKLCVFDESTRLFFGLETLTMTIAPLQILRKSRLWLLLKKPVLILRYSRL